MNSNDWKELWNSILEKFKDALLSVFPVSAIVLVLSFTPLIPLSGAERIVFSVSSLGLIAGIALFNLGADMAMTPMGQYMGVGLAKSGKVGLLLVVSFIMGLLITVSEPDLSVLAGQVSAVMDDTLLIVTVGVGVGLFLLLAVLKIIFKKDLTAMLMFFYLVLFSLAALLIQQGKGSFLPLSFDSGGVTTGPVTVPFIMALGVGIAMTVGGRDAAENSFGLIALCSIGPIIAVMALSLGAGGDLTYSVPDYSGQALTFETVLIVMGEVGRSLLLLTAAFLVLQFTVLRLPWKHLLRIFVGIVYTFAGLVLFLWFATAGFMPVGYKIGVSLAGWSRYVLFGFGLLIGMVVVLAEPAVHVLNNQVEDITNGEVTRKEMMIALSVGVGVSICLSLIRIHYGFSLLYYLIPGYLISLGLSFFVPKIYTAIAFDSGGVASGPLTSSFILPFAIGACVVLRGDAAVLDYAFGVVAMVAMTPLITIQALGFKSVVSVRMRDSFAMRRILEADDDQIIFFDV